MLNSRRAGWRSAGLALVTALALSGCTASSPPGSEFNDPYETANRDVHEFNKEFDRMVFRPVSRAYGTVVPGYLRQRLNNIQSHFSLPADTINAGLQGRGENTVHNFFRFLVNTTVGVFGIFDPATSMGLEDRSTDFGETLFVWGAGEGAYVEVPLFGPYTQRALVGEVVDVFLNPLSFIGLDAPASYIPAGTYVAEAVDYRYEFADTVDGVLYESGDSYAQLRLIYLDNRRFQLGDTSNAAAIDPYEELYGE
ncbi:MlaA family lipoprotein [Meridianimarinicoccus aquatilis]|uniref:VacJ family lipoprotein n=1 Tax=Meridianimarinicoccus aquatilis TaxID=2552766 RepID=A0A4R6AZI8_9RHOB|nr:VacJ family lipoprotein [Fluviibacterium aquatile]QIE40895.1 VacJ family lipoprotein [Rhodobacteraceae bacterium SC52]TDL89204.1 VacJ family lipoprotein [Fluviibacterium aquatile]